jgi:hypothetical protein
MVVSTVKTNRDWDGENLAWLSKCCFSNCRENLNCRDVLFKMWRSRVSIMISTKIEILQYKPFGDVVFELSRLVSTVESFFLKLLRISWQLRLAFLSRSRLLIKFTLRQIEIPRAILLTFHSVWFNPHLLFWKKCCFPKQNKFKRKYISKRKTFRLN